MTALTDPAEITPTWLTAALRRSINRAPDVAEIRVLLTRTLAYSTVARLEIDYGDVSDGSIAPRNLFLKLTGDQTLNDSTDIGRSEVEFYRDIAPEIVCPPLIRCYDAAFSRGTGHAHILMDDLMVTHSQPPDNIAPTVSQSISAVETLAKVHAHWWNDHRLGNGIGSLFDDAELRSFVEKLKTNVTKFIEHFAERLTSEQRRAFQLMLANAEQIWGRLKDPSGLTVTHGDCHWWNFLFPNDPQVHGVHVFDWHLWHIDLGARDLAFLLALGGFAEPRPEFEADLLHAYHITLLANGVSDYSWDKLLNDYRWSAIRNLNIPVIFWQQGKHESTVSTALDRAFWAYERLGCAHLVT